MPYDPKFYRSDEREKNIGFGTTYNNDKSHPLTYKAREYRKENPSLSRDKAFDMAEKALKREGYQARNW